MTYYSCFDQKGQVIAKCQTIQDIEVLKKNRKTNSRSKRDEE